ncbi:MAG: hypothetical protein ACE5HY_04455 [Candidatus Hydrothermarchaeales archaeon]
MLSITSLEFIGGIVTLPFYVAVLYLFFTRARTRYEKRGIFFTIGLLLIVFSYFAEFLADMYSIRNLSILSNAVFGLAGISMIFSCYLSSKWLDEELTGGIA